MAMSDAAVTQSVERCKYQHKWIAAHNEAGDVQVFCEVCRRNPKTQREREQSEAIVYLREWIKPGDTVYTKVDRVSRSGMSRVISAYVIRDNQPQWISYNVARALGWGFDDKQEGVKVGGCGMDMGFHLVYELSYVLFPKYECMAPAGDKHPYQHCSSSEHVNSGEDKLKCGPGVWHQNGYALKQRWL